SLTKLVEQAQSIAQTARDIVGSIQPPADATDLTAEEVSALQATKEELDTLADDFNQIMEQIDQLARDSGYRGTNLLNGANLTIQFNESDTSQLEIEGITFDSVGLGFAAADVVFFSTTGGAEAVIDVPGGTDPSTTDVNLGVSLGNIETALDEAKSALNSLRSQARTFGGNMATIQVREEFTKGLINTLKEGADKLTLADINEEGAKLLSLQTAQQLGITSLALASQAQQSVLRLF
ncbi:MAG: hypothetical protein EA357_00085, partial [Micavibrio sp.]